MIYAYKRTIHQNLINFLTLGAVSSLVVQRHTRWNCNARAYVQWCEAFAPETATSQGEAPPCVPLHHIKRNCSLARHSSDDVGSGVAHLLVVAQMVEL